MSLVPEVEGQEVVVMCASSIVLRQPCMEVADQVTMEDLLVGLGQVPEEVSLVREGEER